MPARDLPKPNLIYELAKRQLDLQLEFIDAIDNKLGLLFSVGSAEAAIAAAFLALKPDLLRAQIAILAVGGLAYLVLALAAVIGLWSREWATGPRLASVLQMFVDGSDEDEVRRGVARRFISDWDANEEQFKTKGWRLRAALVAVIALTVVLLGVLVRAAYQ